MRQLIAFCVALAGLPALHAQSSANTLPPLPKDPLAILKVAAPLYSFNDPQLKPWHLKGTYQLYNENGGPREKGEYELWWVSPNTFRSSWSRPGAMLEEWHTSDGKVLSKATGEHLLYFERQLQVLLTSPLPDPARFDRDHVKVEKERLNLGKLSLPCVTITASTRKDGTYPLAPGAGAGTYCFDSSVPVLRVTRSSNVVFTEFDHLEMIQNRVVAKGIAVNFGAQPIITFSVDALEGLAANQATVTPPADATQSSPFDVISPSAAQARLAKSVPPTYPGAAKAEHITGTVVLDAWIGTDGKVKDVRLVGSPSPLLTKAAKDAVAQWQYQPYLVGGQPQEVNTLVTVIFAMS